MNACNSVMVDGVGTKFMYKTFSSVGCNILDNSMAEVLNRCHKQKLFFFFAYFIDVIICLACDCNTCSEDVPTYLTEDVLSD